MSKSSLRWRPFIRGEVRRLPIIKPPLWCFYYTPPWRFTQNIGWSRLMLKNCYRQYQQYSKVRTMLKNNLISLLDTAFLGASRLFSSPPRADGSEKWVDFVAAFWHCACVCGLSEKAFISKYQNGIIRYQSWYSIGLSSYINSPSLISTSKNCRSVSFLSSTHTLIWRISSDVSTTGGIMLRGTP